MTLFQHDNETMHDSIISSPSGPNQGKDGLSGASLAVTQAISWRASAAQTAAGPPWHL
jgi:hypothetical protein